MTHEETTLPFGTALRDLLIERGHVTGMGNPRWREFARTLEDVPYVTLRKAVTGERRASPALMEACANALGVPPTYFVEYRLELARRAFDVREVGWEQALENLRRWAEGAKTTRRRARPAG